MERLPYCPILGTNITVAEMASAVSFLSENLEELRGEYICISNVHTTMAAFRDPEYQKVQNGAVAALPDGKPLSLVQRRRGYLSARRVPGPDLMPKIFELSKEKGYRHYFYGSSPETISKLEQNLKQKYPYLNIVGMYSPPFRPLTDEEDKAIVKMINDAEPDFVWVALGAPKQEIWMAQHQGIVNAVMLGVGAAFDFEAGTVKRAPKIYQELCLEWFYRLCQDPIRLIPRYFSTNFPFLWNVYIENHNIRKGERKKLRTYLKDIKNKPHVAMIGHKRIPSREGGVEVVVEELSKRYIDLGYAVDAYNRAGYHVSGRVYSTNGVSGFYEGIRIFTIPTFQNGKLNAIVYSFLATLRSIFTSYDVYHFHAEGPCAFLWMVKLFHPKKRLIVTIHGLDWQRAKWGNFASKVLKYGEKQAAKHADEIIVLSRNVQEYFKETYNRDTHYIPNGIKAPIKKEAKKITEKYGLKKNGYILFLARIVPEKGLHYLIEAFKDIDTDLKLVIAGGSSNSIEYVESIKEMAAKDSRIIMTGFVQGQMLEELYSNAYIFVLPSDIEGMALSLLEAASFGNCCLVSDIKENVEVICDQGVTFRHGNVEDLRAKLKGLINHPDEVTGYQASTADYILNRFDWDQVVKDTLDIYQV